MSADVTPVLSIIRLIAKEFADVSDEDVKGWIHLTAPLVGKRVFKNLYNQALALLTAHRMKLAGVGIADGDALNGMGNIAVGNLRHISSYSEGKVSIGFNHEQGDYVGLETDLELTEYGIQFKTLRRMRVLPIVSAAESRRR